VRADVDDAIEGLREMVTAEIAFAAAIHRIAVFPIQHEPQPRIAQQSLVLRQRLQAQQQRLFLRIAEVPQHAEDRRGRYTSSWRPRAEARRRKEPCRGVVFRVASRQARLPRGLPERKSSSRSDMLIGAQEEGYMRTAGEVQAELESFRDLWRGGFYLGDPRDPNSACGA